MAPDSVTRWGVVSQIFHWVGAALIVILIAHGWWMAEVAPREVRLANYSWHGSVGFFVLALTILRLLWRGTHAAPAPAADAPSWERVIARLNLWALYLFMFAASVSGWALAGTSRRPLSSTLLGLPMPNLTTDRELHGALENLHSILSWSLAALVVLHLSAAFYHLWIRKDDIMQRMLPFPSRGEAR